MLSGACGLGLAEMILGIFPAGFGGFAWFFNSVSEFVFCLPITISATFILLWLGYTCSYSIVMFLSKDNRLPTDLIERKTLRSINCYATYFLIRSCNKLILSVLLRTDSLRFSFLASEGVLGGFLNVGCLLNFWSFWKLEKSTWETYSDDCMLPSSLLRSRCFI